MHSNAMQYSAITRQEFWLRVWSHVKDPPPAGSYLLCTTVHYTCQSLHRRPLRSRLPGMMLQVHVAFRFRGAYSARLPARPSLLIAGLGHAGWPHAARTSALHSTIQTPPAPLTLFAKQTKQTKLQLAGRSADYTAISWALAPKLVRVVRNTSDWIIVGTPSSKGNILCTRLTVGATSSRPHENEAAR